MAAALVALAGFSFGIGVAFVYEPLLVPGFVVQLVQEIRGLADLVERV